jgi:fatty acid amide hydrolase
MLLETQEMQETVVSLTDLSASELADGIREGRFSAAEVVEAHIQRIEAVNGDLNAVVIPLFDQARREAKIADEAQRRGEPLGPLHGVPITIKEQFKVAGTDTTIGLSAYIGQPYPEDGPLVSRLRRAGAIILGKTNVPQLLTAWETDSAVYGRANNPFNHAHTPGGSSGGEGAIIAAHGSPLGLGGDLGGSIRVPSHFCGLYGLKPTSGRLTNEDTPSHFFAAGQEAILPQPGPMARTVADLRLALDVLVDPSPKTTVDNVPPVPWYVPDDMTVPGGLRIGVYMDNGFFPASPAIRRAVTEAATALEEMGAIAVPFSPPDTAEAARLFLGILSADGEAMRRALAGEKPHALVKGLLQGGEAPGWLRPLLAKLFAAQGQQQLAFQVRSMGQVSAADYLRLVERRAMYRTQWLQAMDTAGIDAILCPPFALPALTHGSSVDLFAAASYAIPFNVTGLPAGVVPVTTVQPGEESDRTVSQDRADITAKAMEQDSAGLPVGVQVVARHWREDIVLAIMAALEAQK